MAVVKKIKVKILLPVAGKYLLSHNVGDEVMLSKAQAMELIDDKYAVEIKPKK